MVDPHVHHDIRRTLETMLEQLERCQKALCNFLEEKRATFPRFYFIGDDDLLEILGQAQNPAVIQAHLKKLFQGTTTVQFNETMTKIQSMVSASGEVVDLDNAVATSDRVEDWLSAFAEEMKSTLASLLGSYLLSLTKTGEVNFEMYPSQVMCIGELVQFTDSVEASIGKGFTDLLVKVKSQLAALTKQDLSAMPVVQIKVKALVMDIVHNLDVLEHLDSARCRDVHDWAWHKQLRYYVRNSKHIANVCMSDGDFLYTYEYQGNAAKLVHTPLTDRCYLTLVQGMHMGFGGNPYGPAGTGKTESVKALGNAFGRQVLVFNCFDESHQLLTNRGFMFLNEIEALHGSGLMFATYEWTSKKLLYAGLTHLVKTKETNKEMVEFICPNKVSNSSSGEEWWGSGISLVVTPEHNMVVQDSLLERETLRAEPFASRVQQPEWYIKKSAVELSRNRTRLQFMTSAQEGIDVPKNSSSAQYIDAKLKSLRIDPRNENWVVAFLEFYGFWHDSSFIIFRENEGACALCSCACKQTDMEFLKKRLTLLEVTFYIIVIGRGWHIYIDDLHYLSCFVMKYGRCCQQNDFVGHCQVTNSGKLSNVEQIKALGTFGKYTDVKACRTSREDYVRWIGVYFSIFVGDVHYNQVRLLFSRRQLPSDLEGQILDMVGKSLRDLMPNYISMPLVYYHPFAIRTREGNNYTSAASFLSNENAEPAQRLLIKANNIPTCAYNREIFVEKHNKPDDSRPGLLLRQLPRWVFHLTRPKARAVLTGICVAYGHHRGTQRIIQVVGDRIRDQLVCLALHAGCSTHFTYDGSNSGESHSPSSDTRCVIYLTDMWCLDATIHSRSSEHSLTTIDHAGRNRLASSSDVRTIKYTGQTWCVKVPKYHFVVVRRAQRDAQGRVIQASVPTIQGNCDEGIDFHSMGRIFIGLVKCGAWGCFDEFNRLKEDQLSAISQQIQVIQDAIKARAPILSLLGREINVDFNAGIFVTLNPAGKDYGGRSQIPDNLKALFRPVAMGQPDNELIAEVYLQTEGFTQAHSLAKKIVSLFTLSKDLLSRQRHYDWGLRALKAVLNTGGKLAVRAREVSQVSVGMEAELLIKAVRINTLSKLTFSDTSCFLALIGDIFPGVESSDVAGGELEVAIRKVMQSKAFSLSPDETQICKMLQLKEALDQRMGCVVVGPSGCGKSTVWRVLKAALIERGQAVQVHVMNPKSMPRQQLLGEMDLDTREWTDGVLTDAARNVVKEPAEVRSWIVCDGDVDPEWIESLNSVLDDNHLLTLPSGERISFGGNVNFLFETHDLRFASPATISRMGMIFLADEDINKKRVVSKWLLSQDNANRSRLEAWLEDIFYKALDYLVRMCSFVVETTLVGTILNGLSSISGVSTKLSFVVGIIRGLGGNLSASDRSCFAKQVFVWARERPPDIGAPLDCDVDISGEKLFSYSSQCGGISEGADKELTLKSVVQTALTQRTMAQLKPWIKAAEPFIIVGNEGCGKELMIQHAFAQRRKVVVTIINCSAQTKVAHVIAKIQQRCSLFSASDGRVYRPRDCERLVLYLKNLNLPKPDMYGTCMLVAFLQQLVTFGGFYDASLEFLRIEDIQIVASMNPATTIGRHPLSTRFTAIVRIYYLDYPETHELSTIYEKLLKIAFRRVIAERGAEVASNLANFMKLEECAKLAKTLVEIYEKIKATFLVDDARHYLFTPRDLSAWVNNLSQYDLGGEDLLDVISYEGSRIFRDRMVDEESESKLDSIMSTTLRSKFQFIPSLTDIHFTTMGLAAIGGHTKYLNQQQRSESSGPDSLNTPLLVRTTRAEFQSYVQKGVEHYERETAELNMLLFPQILEHISRVDRVISNPGGNLLLIGRSGVGRRTAVKIVSHMHGYDFYNPSLTRSAEEDAMRHFRSELKPVFHSVATEMGHSILYLEDHHFSCEAVLELVNSMLSSGEVPGLFSNEELETLYATMREAMMDEGTEINPYDYFTKRIRRFIHICVAMDPTSKSFDVRCESNPALFTRCTILWMGKWSRSSMRSVPAMIDGVKTLLSADSSSPDAAEIQRLDSKTSMRGGKTASKDDKDVALEERPSTKADVDENLLDALIRIHESADLASPREFMVFLENWNVLYSQMQFGIQTKLKHLRAGLKKIGEASMTVDSLSNDAELEQEKLHDAQRSADDAMEMITKTLSEATNRRAEVHELQREVKEKEEHTMNRQEEIKNELSSIQPVLETAKAAVGQIKAEHLNEIRSLKMPPEPIADVLGAVLKLLGISDVSWTSMKKFLGNRGVKDEILNYDARRIGGEMRKDVARLLKQKASSFDQAAITRVSVAAAPLAAWVKANIRYSVVLEKIQPLESELSQAEDSLAKCNHRLQRCEEEILSIDDRVTALKSKFGEHTREAEKLRARLMMAEGTLAKAQNLLAKLSDEHARWQDQVRELRLELAALPRHLLLAAGFLTYLPRCPEDAREAATNAWKLYVDVTDFSFKHLLSTESQLLAWKQLGLPDDPLSQENALVIAHNPHSRVPFVIDPADAATSWLQAYYGTDPARPLESIPSADARFTNQVELAVRFGKTLLVFDVDTLEPMLYPLIREDILMQGPRCVICLGGKMLDYNKNFRLILATRNPQPDLPPDATALCTLINFTVTRSGLRGQLLGMSIHHEQPELEVKKSQMLKQEEDYKIKLAALETTLLEALATAEGDLLENSLLIDSLSQTKEASREIKTALAASAEVSVELDKQRGAYRGLSSGCCQLYFLVRSLAAINSMYHFSLASFLKLFRAGLLQGKSIDTDATLAERLQQLTPLIERLVFFYVSRSLFKADRCTFALHVVHGMHKEHFQTGEWELFASLTPTKEGICVGRLLDLPSWAGRDRMPAFSNMSTQLGALVNKLSLEDTTRWNHWAKSSQCEREFPVEIMRECTPFQRVLITQCFRPDRLATTLHAFACEILQISALAPPSLNFDQLHKQETEANLPILLITTAGADPSKELADFSASAVGRNRFKCLAMGGGTHDLAMSLLRETSLEGAWLCLQNLHLVVAWLPLLEKAFAALSAHEDFRLWLTTEPHTAFPHVLLQESLKVTFESPPGTKRNMQRTLSIWGRDFFDMGESRHRPQLLFCLAWLHAILQERRTYIPQGWSKFYEFSVGDLRAGAFVMDAAAAAATKSGEVDLDVVHGLIEDAIYGGRIDNLHDARVLKAYLCRIFTRDVIEGRLPLTPDLLVPIPCTYSAAVSAVSTLSPQDTPALFGLPNNIEKSLQRTASSRVSDQLRQLYVIGSKSLLFDREIWRSKLGPLLDHWQHLTTKYPTLNEKAFLGALDTVELNGPIACFVATELVAAESILLHVSSQMATLKKVIHGTALLTPFIKITATCVMMGNVPSTWSNLWDGPEKPISWLALLVHKAVSIKSWSPKVLNLKPRLTIPLCRY